jgi:hypothetical protein
VFGVFWIFFAFELRNRLFPIGTFAIGFGERRYTVLESVRWGVIIGLVISVLSGLVLAFLQAQALPVSA